MKAYWRQGGVHIEAETPEDYKKIETFFGFLDVVQVKKQIDPGGGFSGAHEQPVVAVNEKA